MAGIDTSLAPRTDPETDATQPDSYSFDQDERVRVLAARNEALRDTLLRVSHDLRNPLFSIRALVHFLKSQSDSDNELRTTAQGIEAGCDRAMELVDEMLESASDREQIATVSFEAANVQEILAAAALTLSSAALDKGVVIRQIQSDTIVPCRCRPKQLQSAVENLIANAVKFSPPGEAITIHTWICGGNAAISICDAGPGIDESTRHLLFQEYHRSPDTANTAQRGAGLGLHFCRQIVAAHTGTIDCRNLPSGGCEFLILLPSHDDHATA